MPSKGQKRFNHRDTESTEKNGRKVLQVSIPPHYLCNSVLHREGNACEGVTAAKVLQAVKTLHMAKVLLGNSEYFWAVVFKARGEK